MIIMFAMSSVAALDTLREVIFHVHNFIAMC